MAEILLEGLSKRFGTEEVLAPLDLTIAEGSFVVVVGPSGCGKTTLLRLIAGLEEVSSGRVLIDGRDVTHTAAAARGLAMVFQSHALYPHMNVRENIGFPLKMAGRPAPEIAARVQAVASQLGLGDCLARKPCQLSGGERQRVAIGRALVRAPAAFLLDEPLSSLDAELRARMRLELARLHRALRTTMLLVTHDQIEAMTLAEQIVVLNAGRVEQTGAPLALYHAPCNRFVAGFLGSPTMNFIEGPEAERQGAHALGIRPEHLRVTRAQGLWPGRVDVIEALGAESFLHLSSGQGRLVARLDGSADLRPGETVWLTPAPAHLHRFDAAGRALPQRPG
ncbi:ABC transporter ATP-binding protein [Rhodobacter maris]|uniref:Sorbitol ABC transporter ATP-binding protein /mannitol ABC transporter ATP-binding protein n=1 Tax=Rhodobacter maris TaxID=446682 RepID=A0A285S3H6_9RHOB|nr:ABC transporter ATP-binding protein [Rhodobacter maris]SOB99484.1 sorbitol ABC transporter ATP-binding protein /mannitol ABC transporter ATP-binding protein [Rhodobacter maris]